MQPCTLKLRGDLYAYDWIHAGLAMCNQDLADQEVQLRAAGCDRIVVEKVAGTGCARPQLDGMLDHLRAGELIVVTRLDRLARSIRDPSLHYRAHR
ncbi:recombinase family protein [Paraburkholderia youngii]|uniref:recombinase family protein n=1 Tax=Paraburkholderia youngii TaxID=2782701 RepID=UPI001C377BC4